MTQYDIKIPIEASSREIFFDRNTKKLSFKNDNGIVEALGAPVWGGIGGTLANQTDLISALNDKQPALLSGTNIKTINGSSVLGSGDLVVSSETPTLKTVNNQSLIGNGNVDVTNKTTYFFNTLNAWPYIAISSTPTIGTDSFNSWTLQGFANAQVAFYNTQIGNPGTTIIPAGIWQFGLFLRVSTSTASFTLTPQIFKLSASNVETFLFQGSQSVQISTINTLFTINVTATETALLPTDRIVIKLSVTNGSAITQQTTLQASGANTSYIITTLNKSVPILRTINNQSLISSSNVSANINIIPGRTRQITSYLTSNLNLGTITAMQGPINLSLQVETYSGAGNITIYRSYNANSVSAGSIVAATYTFTSLAVRSFIFKRTIRISYESGSGEDGYFFDRTNMHLVTDNQYSDDIPSANTINTQEIAFNDSNGTVTYPTFLVASTSSTGIIGVSIVEQGI